MARLYISPDNRLEKGQEGYLKAKFPNAWKILNLIDKQLKSYEGKACDLKKGEVLLGDVKELNMSYQNYRTAIKHLEKWNLVDIVRVTNKGKIVKFTNYWKGYSAKKQLTQE